MTDSEMVKNVVTDLSRMHKQVILVLLDLAVLPLLIMLSYALRLGHPPHIPVDWWMMPLAGLSTVLALYVAGFYRAVTRHFSSSQLGVIIGSVSVVCVLLAAAAFMVPAQYTHRSVFVIFGMMAVFYLAGSRWLIGRVVRRLVHEGNGDRIPVAIYGAGGAGIEAAASLANGMVYRPLVFVDDNKSRQKTTIRGLRVVGRSRLARMVQRGKLKMVLIAMPSASSARRNEIIRFLEPLGVPVKTVPAMMDIISGRARIEDVRDVAIEDLLGRDPVAPDRTLLTRCIEGRSVLVTGAAGSIGSELCRQIIKLGPRRLVLLDHSEFGLYRIDQEISSLAEDNEVEVTPVLGSVVDQPLIERICGEYAVETLYHAAAYKHVPIVEATPEAGIRNNVLGTLCVARAAEKTGVKYFTLISTDKAVRPTNVMGATKRLAELVLQGQAARGSDVVFSMVRFGNVLGSSGSVVPLFREQIRKGGPVTVTHPEVTRYFMTIPEAAQLVLQAGGMARGGEVFLLDMGKPVRIYDLATSMIHLMGASVRDEENPDGEIEIVFSGLRPGEKLYEELLVGESSEGTAHPMIMMAHEETLSQHALDEAIKDIHHYLESGDPVLLKRLLQRYVAGYRSENVAAVVEQECSGGTTRPANRFH